MRSAYFKCKEQRRLVRAAWRSHVIRSQFRRVTAGSISLAEMGSVLRPIKRISDWRHACGCAATNDKPG